MSFQINLNLKKITARITKKIAAEMSFNPYASEDFNRIQTKAEKDYETQKKEREEAANQVDHPLMEGKKLDMSAKELNNFTKAMGKKDFRDMLGDYVDEISDP